MHAIGIVSADLKRSLEFYATLGIEVPAFDPKEDHFQCEVSEGIFLMWDTVDLVKQFLPGYEFRMGNAIGLGFDCGSPASVDATYQRLMEAGYQSVKEPWDAFWGQRYSIVEDPDGNLVSVYASL